MFFVFFLFCLYDLIVVISLTYGNCVSTFSLSLYNIHFCSRIIWEFTTNVCFVTSDNYYLFQFQLFLVTENGRLKYKMMIEKCSLQVTMILCSKENIFYLIVDMSLCRFLNPVLYSFMTYHWVCNKSNLTGATRGEGTAHPSIIHESIPGFCSVRVVRSLVFCIVFCRSLFVLFSFGYCIVCSSICGFWLVSSGLSWYISITRWQFVAAKLNILISLFTCFVISMQLTHAIMLPPLINRTFCHVCLSKRPLFVWFACLVLQ